MAHFVNSLSLAAGCDPIVVASMRRGHRLVVDLRSQTEQYAFYSGRYDDELIGLALGMVPPDATVVDVGANVGFYTVAFALHVRAGGGRVFSFEPLRTNYRRLVENILLNELGATVTAWEFGLSSAPGSGTLVLREDFASGSGTGNASIVIPDGEDSQFATADIRLETLDRCALELGLARLDLVKLDVEGHEDFVAAGACATLRRFRPILLMEVNKGYFSRRNVDAYLEMFRWLPEEYGAYKPVWAARTVMASPRILALRAVSSFEPCGELDNIFLIPREALDRVSAQIALHLE